MSDTTGVDRRKFLQLAGLSALSAVAPSNWLYAASNARYAKDASPDFHPNVEIEIIAHF